MRWFDVSPRRATPKGHPSFISCTAPRSVTPLPQGNLPRSWHTPVAQGALVDPKVAGDARDRLTGLEDQPDRTLLEVPIELPSPLCHRPSLKGDVSTVRGEAHQPPRARCH